MSLGIDDGRLAQSVGNGVQTQYLYDANGNLTQQQSALKTFDYQWNTLNQLSKVMVGNVTIEYKYNAAGQRHQRFRTEGAQRQETLYLFDNERPYAEAVAEWQRINNGAWQVTRYVHSLDGTGDLLTILKEGQRYSVHHDGLSSTRLLSDSTATPQTALNYSTFGEPLSTNPANPLTTYQFAGEYYDADTGLIYLRARWMNPTVGRFISMDEFEGAKKLPLSLNKYIYANGDPVNFVDPSGYFGLGGMMSAGMNISISYARFEIASMITNALLSPIIDAIVSKGLPALDGYRGNSYMAGLLTGLASICYVGKNKCYIKGVSVFSNGFNTPYTTMHIMDALYGNGDTISGVSGNALTFLLIKGKTAERNDVPQNMRSKSPMCNGRTGKGTGYDCDEYPYASTLNGGKIAYENDMVSLRPIPLSDNRKQGGLLGSFYKKAGIGMGEVFINLAMPGLPTFYIDKKGKVHNL